MSEGSAAAPTPIKKTPRWYGWLGGVVGVLLAFVGLVRGGDALYHLVAGPGLAACDDSAVEDAVTDIFKERNAGAVTGYAAVTQASEHDGRRTCSARITLAGAGQADLTYSVYREAGKILVRIEDVTEVGGHKG